MLHFNSINHVILSNKKTYTNFHNININKLILNLLDNDDLEFGYLRKYGLYDNDKPTVKFNIFAGCTSYPDYHLYNVNSTHFINELDRLEIEYEYYNGAPCISVDDFDRVYFILEGYDKYPCLNDDLMSELEYIERDSRISDSKSEIYSLVDTAIEEASSFDKEEWDEDGNCNYFCPLRLCSDDLIEWYYYIGQPDFDYRHYVVCIATEIDLSVNTDNELYKERLTNEIMHKLQMDESVYNVELHS